MPVTRFESKPAVFAQANTMHLRREFGRPAKNLIGRPTLWFAAGAGRL